MKDAVQRAIEFNETHKGAFTGRRVFELVRCWQSAHGLEPDGWFGPVSQAAMDGAIAPVPAVPVGSWPVWDGPADRQPNSRRSIYSMFGDPGTGEADQAWVQKNIVNLHHTRGNALPGQPQSRWVSVHRVIEPYLREALRRATQACPEYEIERIAGYVFRHTRHDPSSRPLSVHSWGLAVDINPHLNAAKYFPKDAVPKAFSKEYFDVWPRGLPQAFVHAFESCGFASGIDWDEDGDTTDHTYLDPMHFEWVDRSGGDGRSV